MFMCKHDPVGRRWVAARLPAMARLDFATYLEHLRHESQRFRDVLADCDPDGPGTRAAPTGTPPTCSGTSREVQHFWATIVRTRPAAPDEADASPSARTSYAGLLASFDEYSAALVAALEAADPADEAWTWSTEQTVGFILRRQAHEALIHRLDAELAAGHGHAARPGAGRRRRATSAST